MTVDWCDRTLHMCSRCTPELHVQNQTVFGYEGEDVEIKCLHRNLSGEKKWCRVDGSCLEAGEVNGMSVETADVAGVFRVTLRNLQEKNSGWYWCSVGQFQMPVHITVSKGTIPHTTSITETTPTTEMSLSTADEISECISILNPKKEIWKEILGTLLKFAVALVCLTLSAITAVKLLKLRAALAKDDGNAPDPSAE
ncbi:CMRF35-like molecule 8 [Sardina pilchardus]|uniref:CMRF35-like molecule 8 n=1 Tax=Sardina pilchardus TaxID=27697 RepID=UPI002E1413EB